MATAQMTVFLDHLRRLVVDRRADGLSDHQLLQVFISDNDQNAFTTLVERHGRLVFSVCRHVLKHAQDAEDAFQATFLVLARNARSIRKQAALASWLHGVAYRMAMKAKRDAARRQTHEHQAGSSPATDTTAELSWREAQAILDEEIERMPEKYRSVFVLCCLDNQSRAQAAQQLAIKEGTLSSRLAVARQRLRQRLERRGVTLAGLLTGAVLTKTTVSAALLESTGRNACLYAAGLPVAALSTRVATLAQGVIMMLPSKVKTGLSVVLALSLLSAGSGLAVRSGFGPAQVVAEEQARPANTSSTDSPAPGVFRDVTGQSGIAFTYRNGEETGHCAMLEPLGGGVAILDYDGDGLPDIFLPGGGYFAGPDKKRICGHSCKLFKNLGGGKFADVTKEVGLDGPTFYAHGIAVVDFDCDGWPDLLVTGWGRMALYHNHSNGKGGRRFVDVAAQAGLPAGLWTTSAAWGDLDGDGYPDLYVCQYIDWSFDKHPEVMNTVTGQREYFPPKRFRGLPHKLFRNNGNGTFTDVSEEAGLSKAAPGLGVVIADVDNDGKPDIFVANDTTGNFLYRNQCTAGRFRFVEIGDQAGVARNDVGMPTGNKGIAVGDYDGSGRPSLFVTAYEYEMHCLYRNLCRGERWFFGFDSRRAGIHDIGQQYIGWGTGFVDFDRDGSLDLFIANGHWLKSPSQNGRRQRPVLMRNTGEGKFVDVSNQGGIYFQTEHNARGVAFVDIDNDGRLDLVISHLNEPVAILRNEAAPEHHWIGFELVGKKRRDVVGAKIVVESAARTQTSFAHGGGSYASSSDRRHLFGLGQNEKVKRVRVLWPGGGQQQWDGLATDRYWRLTEGEGAEELRRVKRP
jgi:RNA polymerase sigma factor (sigma-70 family)